MTEEEPEETAEPTIEELHGALEILNGHLASKARYLAQMGLEIPAAMLTKLRVEYWIGAVAETMPDGHRWLAEHEIAWGGSMLTLMDSAISEQAANDTQQALHLP